MNVTISSLEPTRGHHRPRIVIMTAVSVAVLGLTTALGSSFLTGHETAGNPVVAARSADVVGAGHRPDVDEAVEGPWAHATFAEAARDARASTLHLAGSPEDAEQMRLSLDGRSAIAVIDSEAMERRLMQAAGGGDAVSAALGLPPLRVVDQRRP
jgi:hypothetical protein